MEKFMLVEKKKNFASKALQGANILLAVVMLLLTVIGGSIFIVFACIFGFLAFFIARRFIEFEYSYFDGEVRFTKIMNKSRRKKIAFYHMDETVLIAPAGDRSVYNYENDSKLKVRNLTSGEPEARVYVMVTKGEKGMELVKFEPDEEILGEICKKYAQKVKK
jgi:hypothetical protein